MGLLDYYRQFDDMEESEVNERPARAPRRASAPWRSSTCPPLDLSSTEWPELPDAEVVSASVYQARGRLNGYPDPEATQVRRALAEHHYVKGGQIVLGNGATDLMKTAATAAGPRRVGGDRPAPVQPASTGCWWPGRGAR